ncbi:4-alpha-glucanotransferase, chloroplastic/amyloplastic [Physcomitrium patens]|uniref:4-alpha-glucanotransferase n=2 Tax=Physcomitrium patens TaxID=3218 RepID=A0A7I3ZTA5_PHYPA
MELCSTNPYFNPSAIIFECFEKVKKSSILSVKCTKSLPTRRLSLVHCEALKKEPTNANYFVLGNQTLTPGELCFSAVKIQRGQHFKFGKPTDATNFFKRECFQHEFFNALTSKDFMSCCKSNNERTSRTTKKLRKNHSRLLQAAAVALHSTVFQNNHQFFTTIPPTVSYLPNPFNYTNGSRSWLSVMDFDKNSVRMKKWKLGVGIGEDLPAKYQDDDPLKQAPRRRCGILLHPTSLPGPNGIGDFGKDTYRFLDWLKETGCTVWQVLPLVPPGTRGGEDGSPYAGSNANCGNTLLISLEELVKDGLLEKTDLPKPLPVKRMDSSKVAAIKNPLILKAAAKLVSKSSGKLKEELERFRKDPKISVWLEDAALFASIDQCTLAKTWWTWPTQLRDRDPNAMKTVRIKHKSDIDNFIAAQFLFHRQWQSVHKYANAAGIKILGDMPIYIGGHSADVWAHRALFELDPKTGVPMQVSGVPPDAFSATGQLWGSPLYNWKEMAKDRYAWWATRLRRAYELYDEFRIDHFRAFAGYWAIPATAQNAMGGKWKAGPGSAFFTAMREAVGKIDVIAEDLGIITGDVIALRKEIKAPGMAVLQFAFSDNAANPHLPHNHELDQVVYPGTHDNDTCVGWWKKASDAEKQVARAHLRFEGDADVHWEFIRGAVASVARTSIVSMQDVMGLDSASRMNIPATQAGNWGWRVGESDVFESLGEETSRLRELMCRYHRATLDAESTTSKGATRDKRSSLDALGRAIKNIIGDKLGNSGNNSNLECQGNNNGANLEKPKDKP